MKKNLLVLFLGSLFVAINSFAQPTITASGINPVVGDQITGNGTNYVLPGNAGANQTWNLSSMVSTGASTSVYITASSTPYASSFPTANISINMGSGSYVYYKTSSAAWQNLGSVTSTTVSYNNAEDIIRFPFTFNNSYTDTWSSVFISGGSTFYRTGLDSVDADSYGTLITPAGTFSNVLRVHFVQIYQDSTDLGGNPYLLYYHNDEYMWYLNGNHNPIAAVYALTGSAGNVTGGNFMSNVSSINEINPLVSFTLFPNPSVNTINLNFQLSEKQKIEIKIFNAAGALVKTPVSADGLLGMNEYKINVQDLPEGIYFAEMILNGTSSSTCRFTVSK